MKTKLSSLKALVAIVCLVTASCFTSVSAQTKSVWVVVAGTYSDSETPEKDDVSPIVTTAGTFSSNDYNSAVEEITGVNSRVFKFGGGKFTAPTGYKISALTVYGWPRRAGATYVESVQLDEAEVAVYGAEDSPYIFADCAEDVNSTNRTSSNVTVLPITQISSTNQVSSFQLGIKGETHAFAKLTLVSEGTGIGEIDADLNEMQDDTYYDLLGRKVINPTSGIYIQNRKKVIVK